MGKVYLADDMQLKRRVALKVPRFRKNEAGEILVRFYQEARAMAVLRHQNLCTVFDVGEIGGVHYLTMAYIEGRPLSNVLESGRRISPRTVAALLRKLALAMEEAHRVGVIHRDLKPANIIIGKDSQPVIVDFGLAYAPHANDADLAAGDAVMGTPGYMSPEQVQGDLRLVGPASDIYSLGVVLYRLLAGRLPFRGDVSSVLRQILRDEPAPPSSLSPDVDADLENICLKALAKSPFDRFDSMRELADTLTAYLKATADQSQTTVEVRPTTLRSSEIMVLCPICATRIETTPDALMRRIACPSCHTPIGMRLPGAEANALLSKGSASYRLAENHPTPPPQTSLAAPADDAPSNPPRKQVRPSSKGPHSWRVADVAAWLLGATVRSMADVQVLVYWLPTGGLFLMLLYGTGAILVSLLKERDLGFITLAAMPLVLCLAGSGLAFGRFCVQVFAAAWDESMEDEAPEFDFGEALAVAPLIAVPAFLALVPACGFAILLKLTTSANTAGSAALAVVIFLITFPVAFLSTAVSQSLVFPWSACVAKSLFTQRRAWCSLYAVCGIALNGLAAALAAFIHSKQNFFAFLVCIVIVLVFRPCFQLLGHLARRIQS